MRQTKMVGVLVLLMIAAGTNVFAQTEQHTPSACLPHAAGSWVVDFSVWRHPGVAKHPITDFGTVITGYTESAKVPEQRNGRVTIYPEDRCTELFSFTLFAPIKTRIIHIEGKP